MTITRNHEPVSTPNAPAPRRSRWLWVGGVAVMLMLLTAAFILGRGGSNQAAPPPPTPGPTVTIAPGNPDGGAPSDIAVPGQPDGCLGGPDPYTAVLPAQQAAPLDAAGAAGFGRAALRYLFAQYPHPSDWEVVLPQLFVDPTGPMAAAANPQAAAVPPPAGTTTKYSRPAETTYAVTVVGDQADVTVAVYMDFIAPDGTVTDTVRVTQRMLMVAVDGHWKITDAPNTDPMPAAGTGGVRYYPGGC